MLDVRHIGVNVPPRTNPAEGTVDTCLAGQAESFAAEHLKSAGFVTIEWDEEANLPDGDSTAHIWYDDVHRQRILLNEQLLRNGLAVYAGIAHLDRCAERPKSARAQAIQEGIGI